MEPLWTTYYGRKDVVVVEGKLVYMVWKILFFWKPYISAFQINALFEIFRQTCFQMVMESFFILFWAHLSQRLKLAFLIKSTLFVVIVDVVLKKQWIMLNYTCNKEFLVKGFQVCYICQFFLKIFSKTKFPDKI